MSVFDQAMFSGSSRIFLRGRIRELENEALFSGENCLAQSRLFSVQCSPTETSSYDDHSRGVIWERARTIASEQVSRVAQSQFPVERLAVITGTSPRRAAWLFVKEFEVAPHNFVESVRLNQVRGLLEATNLALEAVALDCGFANPEQRRAVSSGGWDLTPQY